MSAEVGRVVPFCALRISLRFKTTNPPQSCLFLSAQPLRSGCRRRDRRGEEWEPGTGWIRLDDAQFFVAPQRSQGQMAKAQSVAAIHRLPLASTLSPTRPIARLIGR